MSIFRRILSTLFSKNMFGMQKYYTAAGQDPRQAKNTADTLHVYIQADWMHIITFAAAFLSMFIPAALFNARAGVTMMWIGGATFASIILGLKVTRAWRRKMFVLGYGFLAIWSLGILYLGSIYPG